MGGFKAKGSIARRGGAEVRERSCKLVWVEGRLGTAPTGRMSEDFANEGVPERGMKAYDTHSVYAWRTMCQVL